MKRVEFDDQFNQKIYFDEHKGDAPPRYDVINFQRIAQGRWEYVKVGRYFQKDKDSLNMTLQINKAITWLEVVVSCKTRICGSRVTRRANSKTKVLASLSTTITRRYTNTQVAPTSVTSTNPCTDLGHVRQYSEKMCKWTCKKCDANAITRIVSPQEALCEPCPERMWPDKNRTSEFDLVCTYGSSRSARG